MNDILERAYADAAADFEAGLRLSYDQYLQHLTARPESKIEEAILIGLISANIQTHSFEFAMKDSAKGEFFYDQVMEVDRPWFGRVHCQAKVLNYRADFLIEVIRGQEVVGKIVVECDGHDFHERTADQAERDRSRDREMTTAGYTVLRFTGREIYRSAASCASGILQMFYKIVVASKPK